MLRVVIAIHLSDFYGKVYISKIIILKYFFVFAQFSTFLLI